MMDWCFSREVDDFVVPRYEEFLDRHPSPDSWSQWGINGSGSFGWPNNSYFKMANLPNEENCNRMQFGKVSCVNHQNDSSSIYGGGSGDSLKRSPAAHNLPDFQVNDSMEADQADDIFLNSLLKEDLRGAGCNDNLLYLSPESHRGMMPADSDSKNTVLDMQSIPCDTPTKYFGNQSFSQSASWDTGEITMPNLTNGHSSDQCDGRQVKSIPRGTPTKYFGNQSLSQSATWDCGEITMPNLTNCHSFDQSHGRQEKVLETNLVLPCDQNSPNRCLGEETSLEESVLEELEAVLTQLTEKTRLCFRDSLYRLAQSSNQQGSTQTQFEGAHDETRQGKTEAAESETNSIDRAVAKLMFNKVDAHTRDLVPAMAAKFEQKPIPCNYSWNNEEIVLFLQPSTLSTDTQVQMVVQQDPKTNTRFN